MAENYKHLYETTKKMLTKYQDEVVPELRRLLDERVDVVRCKECKHWDGLHSCDCHKADENGTPIFMRESDFCSYGERRSE